jgi:hypothetical protein
LAKAVNLINTEFTWKAFFGLGALLPPEVGTAIVIGLKGIRP